MDWVCRLRAWSLCFVSYSQRPLKSNPFTPFVIRGRSFGNDHISRNHAISSRSYSSGTKEETQHIRSLLQKFKEGHVNLEHAISELSNLQVTDEQNPTDALLSSFANLDYHRSERTNFPEVVFAQGKTPEQVALILEAMAEKNSTKEVPNRTPILATRVTPEMYHTISTERTFRHGKISYYPLARIVSMDPNIPSVDSSEIRNNEGQKRVVVATAGTTDIAVAEEAAVILESSNVPVDRIYDVGVAGLHRILSALPKLRDPQVGCIIVCAGMDGALPSVVGGLVPVPVIAVPTSVGYGASFSGVSALLTMLNSCAPGVCVMNIDNGFGAAAFAYKCVQLCK